MRHVEHDVVEDDRGAVAIAHDHRPLARLGAVERLQLDDAVGGDRVVGRGHRDDLQGLGARTRRADHLRRREPVVKHLGVEPMKPVGHGSWS